VARDTRRAGAALRCLALVAAAAVAGTAHQHMDTGSKTERGESFVPRPEQARIFSLGFDALVSDYHWLQAVQIVGSERMGIGSRAPLIARLVDVVTTVDPWVDHPYRFGAVWLTDSIESVRWANQFLQRGIAYHPTDWRNRHYLGFNHFYYLADDTKAAEVLEPAVSMPGAPRYLGSLVAKLRLQRGGLETAASFLAGLAASTDDEYTRAEYLKSLDEVETERRARRLDRARDEYRRRTGRDIQSVADLLRGSPPVLRELPPAHPHFPGFGWELDPKTGRIVSSFYGARYAPRIHEADVERRESWRRQVEAEAS
jgi:hypothetical protein